MSDRLFDIVGKAVSSFFSGKVSYGLDTEGNLEKLYGGYCNPTIIVKVGGKKLEDLDGLKDYIEEVLNKASLPEINILVRRAGYCN